MKVSAILGFLATSTLVAGSPIAGLNARDEATPAFVDAVKDTPPDGLIRLKDLQPDAPNGETVIGRIWNTNSTSVESPKLAKRYGTQCYGGDLWVLQDKAQRTKNGVCNWLQGNSQLGYGNARTIEFSSFQDANGNWQPLLDTGGSATKGWWYLKSPASDPWDWNNCYNTFFEAIWSCPGTNPDTAGGKIWGYGNGWEADYYWRRP